MAKLWMPPDIVIRPSGVWDSRAPFHTYLKKHKLINRSYALAILTTLKVKRDLGSAEPRSIRKYFNPRIGPTNRSTPRDTSAWKSYRRAFGRSGEDFPQPTLGDITKDLEGVIVAVRRATLVNSVALFETYLQCWALNHLLSKLEAGSLWTNEERLLASKLSPVHGTEVAPSSTFILRCLPFTSGILRGISPFKKHPATHLAMERPEPPDVNCFAAVEFSIDLRNMIVHRAGWITRKFSNRYGSLWGELFCGDPHIGPLEHGNVVLVYHELISNVAVILYRAALALSDALEIASNARRGHPWAPDDRPAMEDQYPVFAPPLLMENDHQNSWRWSHDEQFRQQFIQTYSR